jgi:hypothetical protein
MKRNWSRRAVSVLAVIVIVALAAILAGLLLGGRGASSSFGRTVTHIGRPGAAPPPPGPASTNTSTTILHQLHFGHLAYNAPSHLAKGQTQLIALSVSPTSSIRQLKATIVASGRKIGARARLAPVMQAALTGLGFRIDPPGPQEQPVAPGLITTWQWQVTPTQTGTLTLALSLKAVVYQQGRRVRYTVRTFDETWNVEVSWRSRLSGFIGTNWKWFVTAIIIPLVVWLYKSRQEPKEPPSGATPTQPTR